ncbi:MAG: hypothetical protein ABSF50_04675 [Burkholderiaceae bacterium]|jgi:hypothetical protein
MSFAIEVYRGYKILISSEPVGTLYRAAYEIYDPGGRLMSLVRNSEAELFDDETSASIDAVRRAKKVVDAEFTA